MLTINITIGDAHEERACAALAKATNYHEQVPDPDWEYNDEEPHITRPPLVDNPTDLATHVSNFLKHGFIKDSIVQYEGKDAREKAQKQARQDFTDF